MLTDVTKADRRELMKLYGASNLPLGELHHLLTEGGVLIYPTETLYGIGCNAWHEAAVARVMKIKGRAENAPPPILVGSLEQASTLVQSFTTSGQAIAEQFWPGALTLILPAHPQLPASLCGLARDGKTRTVGVRFTAHPLAQALCCGGFPLLATSANFSGQSGDAARPYRLADIPTELQKAVDAVVDGGTLGGVASTLVDCTATPPCLLRAGAVNVDTFLSGVLQGR